MNSPHYTMSIMSISEGDAWTRVYDGSSQKSFRRHFDFWSEKSGIKIAVICPRKTAGDLCRREYPAEIDVRISAEAEIIT